MKHQALFFNANFHTLNPSDQIARSLLTSDGRIAALNLSPSDIETLPPSVARLDLQEATVTPGFIDTHLHVPSFGKTVQAACLYEVRSITEILDKLTQEASRHADCPVTGRAANFQAALMQEKRLPTAADLDRVATNRPVLLFDVNKLIVNSFILKQLSHSSPIPLDARQHSEGLFRGSDARTLLPILLEPASSAAALEQDIRAALQVCAAHGITRVVNACVNLEQADALRRLNATGGLPLHVMALMSGVAPSELAAHDITPNKIEGHLSFGPIKFFWDCMIMHKTAWMHTPYVDDPQNYGKAYMTPAKFRKILADTFDAGWAVAVHCTGDRAFDELTAMFDAEQSRMTGLPRSHIIHTYFPTPKSMAICRELDIGLAVQPDFIRCWCDTLIEFLGPERATNFLPLRSLLQQQVHCAGSSDAPYAWPSVLTAMATAMTRRTACGVELEATEQLSASEALRLYTINAARLVGREQDTGSLEPGKAADFTILNQDLLNSPAQKIADAQVLMTVVGGNIVYQAPSNSVPCNAI